MPQRGSRPFRVAAWVSASRMPMPCFLAVDRFAPPGDPPAAPRPCHRGGHAARPGACARLEELLGQDGQLAALKANPGPLGLDTLCGPCGQCVSYRDAIA